MNIPSAIKDRHALRPVLANHFLGSNCESDFAQAGLQVGVGQMKSGTRTRTSILHVGYRHLRESHVPQCNLAWDHVLPFHWSLRRIGEERRTNVLSTRPGIDESGFNR